MTQESVMDPTIENTPPEDEFIPDDVKDSAQTNPEIKQDENSKVAACQTCAFCVYSTDVDGKRKQVDCCTGQLDRFRYLEKRLNKNFLTSVTQDNGDISYGIFRPCLYSRSSEYAKEHFSGLPEQQGLLSDSFKQKWHKIVRGSIPFPYLAVIIANGNFNTLKQTIDMFLTNTMRPHFLKVIVPYKFKDTSLVAETIDYLATTFESLPEEERTPYGVNKITLASMTTFHDYVMNAITSQHKGFYICAVREGAVFQPDFFESLRNNIVDNFFDFHCIKLAGDEFIMPKPLFMNSDEIEVDKVYDLNDLCNL